MILVLLGPGRFLFRHDEQHQDPRTPDARIADDVVGLDLHVVQHLRRGNDRTGGALGLDVEVEASLDVPAADPLDGVDGQVDAVVEVAETAPQTAPGRDGV